MCGANSHQLVMPERIPGMHRLNTFLTLTEVKTHALSKPSNFLLLLG